jgi:membrane protease YdiL (CAAX protease family)
MNGAFDPLPISYDRTMDTPTPSRRRALFAAALLAPVVLGIGFTILGEFTAPLLGGGLAFSLAYALILGVGAAITLWLVNRLARTRQIPTPLIGPPPALAVGTGLGLLTATLASGIYFFVNRPRLASPLGPALRPEALISNLGVGALEEIGFRAGLVHTLYARWGVLAGLLGGSVPFGLLHILGFIFGRPPSAAHVIGVSFGGWFLSLLYLRWGLLAAAAGHWIWNSAASNCARVFGIKLYQLESAWSSNVAIGLCILALHLLAPPPARIEAGPNAPQT